MSASAGPSAVADANAAALATLAALDLGAQLAAAAARLAGAPVGPLAAFALGCEDRPDPARIDGRLLEAICGRALAGVAGAVFTSTPEAEILAAFGLAQAAARRGSTAPAALAVLLGTAPPTRAVARALDGLVVLDPACGGGALLAAADRLSRRAGARVVLEGIDVAAAAVRAASARLALRRAAGAVRRADALDCDWPAADLVLANPPFVRHERLAPSVKARAAARSGLSRQADLAAHFAAVALRHASTAALVLPSAVTTARSAAPLLAEARARGGFTLWLRSRVAGSFAASVATVLAVWAEGSSGSPPAEAAVALSDLSSGDLAALARGTSTPRLRRARERRPAPRLAVGLGDLCRVRFGMKSGCNGFFHLVPVGGDRYRSAMAGEVRLDRRDVAPLLASLKEARAPEVATPGRVLFRPLADSRTSRAYVGRGEALGVHLRPTCAGRAPWWRIAGDRGAAPLLYPAKVGARAFAFLNEAGLLEDKKWHALFPGPGIDASLLAMVLCATPVRLAIDAGARQLTGAQAIADVDCRVLAAAPCPSAGALHALAAELAGCRAALARDPVTTEVRAMLDRPAQRELDAIVGGALGMSPGAVARARRDLAARVAARLEHAGEVRRRLAAARPPAAAGEAPERSSSGRRFRNTGGPS